MRVNSRTAILSVLLATIPGCPARRRADAADGRSVGSAKPGVFGTLGEAIKAAHAAPAGVTQIEIIVKPGVHERESRCGSGISLHTRASERKGAASG